MKLSYTQLRKITDYWVNQYNDENSTNVEYQKSHEAFEELRNYIINTPFHIILLRELKYQSIQLWIKIKNIFKPKYVEMDVEDIPL